MKQYKLIYLLFICISMSLCTLFVSCDDEGEIVDPNYSRLFAPVNLVGEISNKTNVTISWAKSEGADSYLLEIFMGADESGEKIASYELTAEETFYTITGLEGETEYMIRVKAKSQGKEESKWNSIVIETGAEQIFYAIADDELEATKVTLRWPAGQYATSLVLTPGDKVYPIEATHIAAGAITIDGLTPETKYTAKLMNGEKTRGTLTFETLLDLGGAIKVEPEDDLVSIIAAANDNDVFALMPGKYKTGKLSILKNIAIKAAKPADRPILSALISLDEGVSFELKDIILDGFEAVDAEKNADQAIQFNKANVTYGDISITGCEIRNYHKGFLYFNVKATAESVTISNCIIYDILCDGGDFFDCRLGTPKTILFTNNTVYNSAASRDWFRIDDKSGDFPGVAPILTITNNTLVGISNNASRRLFYVRWKNNSIIFKNNIIAESPKGTFKHSSSNITDIEGNNYFNSGTMEGSDSGSPTSLDPGFADAAKGDFTISNNTLINNNIGDPRWIK